MMKAHMKHRTPRRRAGSVYVFVLSTATLAAAAGTTAIILHGARLDRVELGAQAQRATEDAQSALEYAVATVSADPGGTTWRSSATLAFSDKKYFGAEASSVTITLTDPTDNDLADTNLDPVAVTVKAVLGPCEQSYEVTMGVAQTPMSCLDYALTVGGTLTKLGTGEVYTGGTISSGRAWETDSDPRPSVTSALSVVQAPASGDAPVTVLRRGGGGAPKGGADPWHPCLRV